MRKKILVTGANGFVGRALCMQLVKLGLKVCGTVRSKHSLQILPGDIDISVFDLSDFNTNEPRLFKGVESVVHLAARVHVLKDTARDPLDEFRRINVFGTENLAKQAAAGGVKRFIFISSVKVNGEEQFRPYTESDKPSPQDSYGISKWEAEKALHRIARETGMQVIILRPPIIYGPGVKANFLRLIKLLEKGVPLPLAAVQNQRSMIYLGNLIDAIITCMHHDTDAKVITHLVSDGEDISTPDLIRKIAAAIGKRERLFRMPIPFLLAVGNLAGNSKEIKKLIGSLAIDISGIRNEIGWHPPYSMADGLQKTADWYRSLNMP